MNKMNFGNKDLELTELEKRFSQILREQRPSAGFYHSLRDELSRSKIFELRRSLGAILVASFAALFAGALSASIILLAHKSRRRLTV